MKLARIGAPMTERACVVRDDLAVDVSSFVRDFDEEFFGSERIVALRDVADAAFDAGRSFEWAGMRFGAPIARPHQILCVGLNYADHARETGQAIPVEPIIFNKSPNTLVGPDDDVLIPPGSVKTDWEVELGIVIGRGSYRLPDLASAERAIAGYVVVNDVSEREYQLERGGQWVKGKSAPTFNPCGPFLVTPDEVGDVRDLAIWLDLNGRRMQDSRTSQMIFGPAHLVHHLSQFLRLEPGDLVNTGTPPGVGMGLKPPRYLTDGDRIELGIDGLGMQRQTFRATRP